MEQGGPVKLSREGQSVATACRAYDWAFRLVQALFRVMLELWGVTWNPVGFAFYYDCLSYFPVKCSRTLLNSYDQAQLVQSLILTLVAGCHDCLTLSRGSVPVPQLMASDSRIDILHMFAWVLSSLVRSSSLL
jgi:hypothetical protein